MARGLPRGGATRRVRVETLSEGISEGRVLLARSREAQTSRRERRESGAYLLML